MSSRKSSPATPAADASKAAEGSAGGFKPAADYVEGELDITQYLVRNPLATFFFRVEGNDLKEEGVTDGDTLVVDRSITPRHGHIVVAFVEGERLVRKLHSAGARVELRSGGSTPPVQVDDSTGCDIWGVVVGRFKRIPA